MMSNREHAKYWLFVLQTIVKEQRNRRRDPAEERLVVPCKHCKGSVIISVRYRGDILSIDAYCFNESCQFPYLEGEMTMSEVQEEAVGTVGS